MKKFLLFFLMLAVLLTNQMLAQDRAVTGTVTSADDGSAVPGVNVVVKGTTNGGVTDIEGNYKLTVPGGQGTTLVFSFIGMVTQEIEIGSRSVIDVQMVSDFQQLSEVVVTGYGTVQKNAYTGSASLVNSSSIEDKPFTSLDQALQGNVAGLQMSATSGTPGSDQNIRIRGVSSITANNEPLYVIDGVPVVSGTNAQNTAFGNLSVLSSINPNDVESISVLKDASATAIYGARGSNGVIVITTKSGVEGKPKFSFSAQRGTLDRAVEGPKMLNSAQWNELYYESLVNAGYATDAAQAESLYPSGWDGVTDTDWRKAIARDKAISQSYDISVNGGSSKTNYYASLGHFKQDGVNLGTDYQRTSGKLNLSQEVNKVFSFSTSINGSFVEQNGNLEGSAYFSNPDAAYLFTWPIDKPRNDDGTPNLNLGTSTYNPIYNAEHQIYNRKQSRVVSSSSFIFNIIEGLKFTSQIGLDYLVTDELQYRDGVYGDGASVGGYSYADYNRNFNWNWKNIIDYSWRINEDNKLSFKAVYEAQKNQYYTVGTGGIGIAADGLYYPNSVATPDYASGYLNDWSLISIMGLVNYTFKGNVFIDGTLRREGNSRFAPAHRWGTFYSLGASWVFSDEAFMQGVSNWLSTSKIRASYGKTGNAGVGLNQYQALLSYDAAYNSNAGAYPASNPGNTLLSWENSTTLNFALDFGFIDRINGSFEYFIRENSDLLLDVPLSLTSGFDTQTQNVGTMVNKGLEITLSADVISTDDFKWNLGLNATSVHNEVTELPVDANGEEIGITTSTRKVTVGEPVYSWFLRTWAGVDSQTGEPLWYIDGEGATTSTYTDANQALQGNSATPTFYGSVNTRFDFYGVYLTASMYYSTGNSVYDSWAYYTQSDGRFSFNVATAYARQYDRWQQPGDVAPNPQNIYGNTSSSNSGSTRRLYDDTYWRLRDVTLGYNLPKELVSKAKLSGVNVYVRGTNMWTKVKDPLLEFDPEIKADGFIDLNAPPLKSVVFGLRVDF